MFDGLKYLPSRMKTTKYVRQRFKSRGSLLRMVQDVSLNKLITGLTVIILVGLNRLNYISQGINSLADNGK
jgi:hypothetical protein